MSDIILEWTKCYNQKCKIYRIKPYDPYRQMLTIEGNGFIRDGLMAEMETTDLTKINLSNLLQCYITINDIYIDAEPSKVILYTNDNIENQLEFTNFDKTENGFRISMWDCGLVRPAYNSWMISIEPKETKTKYILKIDFSSSLYDNKTCCEKYNHSNCSCNEVHLSAYIFYNHYVYNKDGIDTIMQYPECSRINKDERADRTIPPNIEQFYTFSFLVKQMKKNNIEHQKIRFERFVNNFNAHKNCYKN